MTAVDGRQFALDLAKTIIIGIRARPFMLSGWYTLSPTASSLTKSRLGEKLAIYLDNYGLSIQSEHIEVTKPAS